MAGTTPRLLVTTGALMLSPLDWVMNAFADAGFDGVELLVTHNPDTHDPDRVLSYARDAGLDVPVVHGPYQVLLRNVLGANYADKTRRSLELARDLGAELLVAHGPFRWERKAYRWACEQADDAAGAIGPRFGMENLFPVAGRNLCSVVTLSDLAPFRHVVFDTSHFAVAGIDLFDAWNAVGDRVAHLHVSDNLGTGKDSHAPIGTGTLPLTDFLEHVGSCGYEGAVTLELDCRYHMESRDDLVAFLKDQRGIAERALSGATRAL